MSIRQLTRFAPVLFNGGQSLTAQVQALFASRAGGMWDMGDTSTLFQDTAGATPITAVTQPIGMVLDKSRGLALGTEAVPSINWNGGYTTNGAKQIPTGWFEYTEANVASATVLPNSYQFTATAHLAGIELALPAAPINGKFNKITIRARKTAFVSGTPTLQLYTGAWQEIVPSGAAIGDWYTKTIHVLTTTNLIISSFTGSASWEVEYLTAKELLGNHATQPTAGSRPLFSARKNLLAKTEVFTDAAWAKVGVTVTANNATAPDGTLTASTVTFPSGGGANQIYQSIAVAPTPVTQGVWLRSASTVSVDFGFYDSVSDMQTISVTSAWTYFTKTRASGLTGGDRRGIWIYPNVPATIEIWHPQIEVGSVATSYQRVNTASDYDTVGFPAFAQFDGINDILQATGINLSATDKVLIGLAFKSNSISLGMLAEYSPNAGANPGAFYISENEGGAGKSFFKVNNGGSEDIVMNTSAMAATNTTLVAYADLTQAAALSKITARINGAAAALSTIADAADSPGNFGNYDLFLGARSGSSVPSNMNLYRAFVLAGSSTAGEQLILENWLRESCGV